MSYKYIPIEDYTLLKLLELQSQTDLDLITLLNGAVNCLNVYLENETVRIIVDDFYSEDDEEDNE